MMQYFEEDIFWKEFPKTKIEISLQSTDSYNEFMIYEEIKKIGIQQCAAIALQLSIVGMGQKTYGKVKVDDKIIDIREFFLENKINFHGKLNDKLEEHDLTPRRIVRFFRFFIQRYLYENKNVGSYLYKKYCSEKNEENRLFIFPGVEHYLSPEQNNSIRIVKTLLKTYEFLDNRFGTNIKERIIRALLAKGFNHDLLI